MAGYLTKSKFKVAYECPRKLYYNEHSNIYGNLKLENEFLKALAQGGFQVGALAKLQFEGGIDLEDLSSDQAIFKTRELLQAQNVTIFEAAIQIEDFLIRVDVLQKIGKRIELIEVKSKSHDFPLEGNGFFKKKKENGLLKKWDSYLIDVAFQTWVARHYFGPSYEVSPFLMLVDKTSVVTVDNLHQNFLIRNDGKKGKVLIKNGLTKAACGNPIVKICDVSEEVAYLLEDEVFPTKQKLSEFAQYLADQLLKDQKGLARHNGLCKDCEFRIGEDLKAEGLKSGFEECWIGDGKLQKKDLKRPMIFDIWYVNSEKLLAEDILFMDQVDEEDIKAKSSTSDRPRHIRQMIQIDKVKNNDKTPWVDRPGLAALFKEIKYPIHCIDFETSMSAIPFHKGRRPYEQIAFQFSHHIMEQNGHIAHADQFIHLDPGEFPNFSFLRALKRSLNEDDGTIFRYARHENTVLRQIYRQLEAMPPDDASELKDFINSITVVAKTKEAPEIRGERSMIDLLEVVLDHYYHPLMGGSNSIKKVIPAVLQESKHLQEKYSKPIYGRGTQISSLNLEPTAWINTDKDRMIKDPYKLLPPMFSDIDQEELERLDGQLLIEDDEINDGGAAMTAWARMQFTEMTALERSAAKTALLKYCELDTLSMIWLLEYFKSGCA